MGSCGLDGSVVYYSYQGAPVFDAADNAPSRGELVAEARAATLVRARRMAAERAEPCTDCEGAGVVTVASCRVHGESNCPCAVEIERPCACVSP